MKIIAWGDSISDSSEKLLQRDGGGKRILVLLTTSLLLYQGPPVRSDLDADRICGYGTSRCRTKCQRQEFRIGKCPNTYPCCLKKWAVNSLNPARDRHPVQPGP
ncbi:beta-defensin 104A-like [Hippopotamus amphibius kiboko]|uniref:beta-defensin 104A-like n=1 Tax=Hippopotamus amphibius kiboko TaxID=575201 RepID=UPI00259A0522|nr:beta-defensin 104A-like [Hippopotamus amphibius kiboko]